MLWRALQKICPTHEAFRSLNRTTAYDVRQVLFSSHGASAPPISTLARERELFVTHLEAGGTRRPLIHTVACHLLQIIHILGLRRLRDVTLEEVDHAANCWSKLRNQDSHYTAGRLNVQHFCWVRSAIPAFPGTAQDSTHTPALLEVPGQLR
jgi:hypothetical protein